MYTLLSYTSKQTSNKREEKIEREKKKKEKREKGGGGGGVQCTKENKSGSKMTDRKELFIMRKQHKNAPDEPLFQAKNKQTNKQKTLQ